jgi:hypothetical protein
MASKTVLMSAGLVVVGLLLAGYGVAGSVGSSQCGTFVSVDQTEGQSDLPQTQFSELSEQEQQLFKQALNSDELVSLPEGESYARMFEEPIIVVYEGEQCRTGLISGDGCVSLLNSINSLPIAVGSLLFIAGIYGTARTRYN